MIRKLIITCSIFICFQAVAQQHKLFIDIVSLPSYHQAGSDIYVAGSFNGWNPKDEKYKMEYSNGSYHIEIKVENKIEYKFTRGGWDKGECMDDGKPRPNRDFSSEGDELVDVIIKGWSDHFASIPKVSTASKNVHVIDTAFLIPQLNRTRRVWIYLPPDYSSSKKNYPVLYMHDGQNVFDDLTSYVGEWGVDEFMDSIKDKACIVVGVDHGGAKRFSEYCPYDFNTKVGAGSVQGKGEGDQYVDFLAQTLKPYIDKNYRTKPGRENTFVAGSSMGGIISMYAVLKYPDVFGGAGVFSPAFWVGPKIFDDIKEKGNKVKAKIYFYAGGKESYSMVPDMQKAYEEIKKVSKPDKNFISVVDLQAMHNESAWRKYFPQFYLWLIDK